MEKHIKTIEKVISKLEKNNETRLDPSELSALDGIGEDNPNVILNEEDFSPLGSGENREVYGLPDEEHVVKIDLTIGNQNENEVERWQRCVEDLDIDASEVLAPIVEYDEEDYKWVIMKRVDSIGLMDDDWEKIDENTDYSLMKEIGLNDVETLEFGWYQDEIVAYDFGS
jgi:hypothetical protein